MAGDRVRTFQTSPELHDACKQTYGALCPLDGKGTYEPVAFERMVSTDLASTILWIHGQLHPNRKTDTNFLTMDLCIYTENGELVSQIQKLKLVPAPKEKTLGEQLLIANEEEQLFTIKTFIHNQLAKGLKLNKGLKLSSVMYRYICVLI